MRFSLSFISKALLASWMALTPLCALASPLKDWNMTTYIGDDRHLTYRWTNQSTRLNRPSTEQYKDLTMLMHVDKCQEPREYLRFNRDIKISSQPNHRYLRGFTFNINMDLVLPNYGKITITSGLEQILAHPHYIYVNGRLHKAIKQHNIQSVVFHIPLANEPTPIAFEVNTQDLIKTMNEDLCEGAISHKNL